MAPSLTRPRLLAAAIAAAVIAPGTVGADPGPAVHASIGAALSEDGGILEGRVALRITNDTETPLVSIPLWLYPNRFAKPAPGLTDRTVNWIYPAGWSPGGMEIREPRWNGEPLGDAAVTTGPMPKGGTPGGARDVIARVALPLALEPGSTGILELGFTVTIPERRGRFGRWRGDVALGGGWFPRPLTDLTGLDTTLPPARILVEVRLLLPSRRGAVLHDRVFPWSADGREIEAAGIEADAVTLVVLGLMEVTERTYPWGTGVYVGRELRQRQPGWKETRGRDDKGLPTGMKALGRIDYPARALDVLGRTAGVVRDLAPGYRLPERVVMVEVPAWDRLVQDSGGVVLASNRIWRLLPAEAVLAFHDIALARVLGTVLAAPAADATERAAHRKVSAEIVGSRLGDLYADEAHDGMRSVKDLVGFAAFMPKIDNLLYAPEIPFRESYSIFVEEEDPLRDAPGRFANRLPGGRRVAAKLVDLLGEEETTRMLAAFLEGEAGLDESIIDRLGGFGQRFFDQWYGPYPSVNYRIAATEDLPLGDGKHRHRARIARDGDDIEEPVTVRITDDDGASADVTWNGKGGAGWVEWTSGAPLDSVALDPGHRLVEDPALTEDHPLADNSDPLPWRPPLLTRLLFWGDSETFEPSIQVGVALRRRFDVTNSFHLGGSYTPRNYGGTFSYYRYFCAKRTLNARSCYFGPTVAVTRHEEAESGGAALPEESLFAATMGGLSLAIGRDTRDYFTAPRSGSSVAAWISYFAGRADDGHAVQVGTAGARGFVLRTPTMGHTFALYGGVTGLVGEPPATDLATLSNRLYLRGFEIDETYGRVGLYAVTEYRHNIVDASGIGLIENTAIRSMPLNGRNAWHLVQLLHRFFCSAVLCSRLALVTIPPSAKNDPYFLVISREFFPCQPKPALMAASFNGRMELVFWASSQISAM